MLREAAIIAGWAATVGGFFLALTPGQALMAAGTLTLVLALVFMGGD